MRLSASIVVVLVAACSPYSPSLEVPFLCGTAEPRCPEGYTCGTDGVCTNGQPLPIDGSDGPQDGSNHPPHDGSGSSGSDSGTCASPFTGDLATWSLGGETGDQTSTPVTTTATGITAGDLGRSAGLTPSAGTGSISSSGWPTGGLDPTLFYTFTITAPAGCQADLTSLTLDLKASGTGPVDAAVSTSVDSFASNVPTLVSSATVGLNVTNTTGTVEVRVYGFSATATTGTMRIQDDLVLSGALH